MSRSLRRLTAALGVAALVAGSALPASAGVTHSSSAADRPPPSADAIVLRPLGMVATVLGTGLFVASLPFYAITRPTDIGKTFDTLVMAPVRFTWVDPLGSH